MNERIIEKIEERINCCPCLLCLVRPSCTSSWWLINPSCAIRGIKENEVFVRPWCDEFRSWLKENVLTIKTNETHEVFIELFKKKLWEVEGKLRCPKKL